MRRLIISAALALGLFLVIAPSALAAPRVVVLRVEYEGRVPEASKVFLSERLVEGLAGAGFEVSAGDVLASATDGGVPAENCRAEDCYRKIAGRLALDYLVIAHITIREKNYDLKLQLVGTDGRAAGSERVGCELCGIQEVGEKLDKLASSLLTAALAARRAVAPARITVQSEPAGASVTIDGRAAGETPFSIDLSPGSHDLTLSASGHATAKKKITLDAGVRGLVSVGLLPLGGGVAAPVLAGRYWLAMGWAALALGAAAVGAGVGVFTLDGNFAKCPGPDPAPGSGLTRTSCRRNTRLAAGALIGAGGATMAAGGFFLFMGWGSSSPGSGEAVLAREFNLSIGGKF